MVIVVVVLVIVVMVVVVVVVVMVVPGGGSGGGENWDKMNRLIIGSRRRITGLAAQDYTQLTKIQSGIWKYREEYGNTEQAEYGNIEQNLEMIE